MLFARCIPPSAGRLAPSAGVAGSVPGCVGVIRALAVTGIVRLCGCLDLLEREIREKLYDICLKCDGRSCFDFFVFAREPQKRMMRGTLFDEVQKQSSKQIANFWGGARLFAKQN